MGQGPVVDSDFIDEAGEILPPEGVAAYAQGAAGNNDRAADRPAADLAAVDEYPQNRPVVGCGQMRPGVEGEGLNARGGDVPPTQVHIGRGTGCIVVSVEAVSQPA